MDKVDQYLNELPEEQRKQLLHIRKLVTEMVPEAEEGISYGMPGFRYKGKYLLGYAAFKDHLSFFPTSKPVEEFKENLKGYKTSKGTIQFTVENPLPDDLLRQIVNYRINNL